MVTARTAPRSTLLLLLASLGSVAAGASATKPHPHQGLLSKYERVSPSKYGIKTSGNDNEYRRGEPVLSLMDVAGGYTRAVSVQDVHAPESVIWDAIMDLNNYPKYVEGVVECKVYSDKKNRMSGEQVVCSTYKLKAAGFSMTYFMKHIFEAKKHSMTFHLDYDRCSELSDTVGYWYVEQLKDGWCRVYYSTDSQLPRFIPGFAKDMLTKMASKRSTAWVEKRCNEVTGFVPSDRPAVAGPSKPSAKALLLALLAAHLLRGQSGALLGLMAKARQLAPF